MRDPSDDIPVVHITDHAYERAKERLSWKTSVLEKMAEKAYNDGICHKDTKGSLNKYVSGVWARYKKANRIRIYGENIYLFCGNSLVTIYQLPQNLRKHVTYCQVPEKLSTPKP